MIKTSFFIDTAGAQIRKSRVVGAVAVELNTGPYADAVVEDRDQQRRRVVRAVKVARREGLEVLAGHGLTYKSALKVSKIRNITELNIGHFLIR